MIAVRSIPAAGEGLRDAAVQSEGPPVRVSRDRLKQLNIHGGRELVAGAALAALHVDGRTAYVGCLDAPAGEKLPARVRIEGIEPTAGREYMVHVGQLLDGNPVGGVTAIVRMRRPIVNKERLTVPLARLLDH